MSNPILSVLREAGWLGGHRKSANSIKTRSTATTTRRKHNRPSASERKRHKHLTVFRASDVEPGFSMEPSNWRDRLLAIVIPSGLGKTEMASKYGWLDCDNLIEPSLRHEIEEEMYESIIAGRTWAQTRERYVEACACTLDLMNFQDDTVLLVHDLHTANMLGLQQCGVINYSGRARFLEMTASMEKHRQVFAEINRAVVEEMGNEGGNYVPVDSFEEVEMAATFLSGIHSIPICAPGKFGPECPTTGHATRDFLGDEGYDLDRLIEAEQAGEIPRCTVEYHVKRQKLVSYKGYGVTYNDWACVMAKARMGPGEPADNSDDWVPLDVMTAENLGKYLKLGEGEDMDYLLQRHQGADPNFLLNLLVHWKTVGVKTIMNRQLIKLYGLPMHVWHRVHTGVRRLMIRSETYMGMYITMQDRQALLDLHNVRLTSGSSLVKAVMDTMHDYVATHAGVVSNGRLASLTSKLPDCSVSGYFSQAQINALAKGVGAGGNISDWGLEEGHSAAQLGKVDTCRDQIAMLLAGNLLDRWDLPDAVAVPRVALILHKIRTDWHRVAIVRDEWSQATLQLLNGSNPRLAKAACRELSCDYDTACSGDDWSVRVYRFLQRAVIAVLCQDRIGNSIEDRNGRLVLDGVGHIQRIKALADINLPRHMLAALSEEESKLALFINKLRNMDRSPTMCILMMLNLESLLPLYCDLDTKISAMAYMANRYTERVGEGTVRACLSVYYRAWFGEHLSTRRMTELQNYTYRSDAKIKIPDASGTVRVFRREFRRTADSVGILGPNAARTVESLNTLKEVRKFQNRMTLLSDVHNPETVVKRRTVEVVHDPVQAAERLMSLRQIGLRELRYSTRPPADISDQQVYGMVNAVVASLVDGVSSNPAVRASTAKGLWHIMPSHGDDIDQISYQMKIAMDDIAEVCL